MPRLSVHAALLAATLLWGTTFAQVSESVHVGGNVANPLDLTVSDLRTMPRHQMDDLRKISGADGKPQAGSQVHRRYVGVRLRELLDCAFPTEPKRHDLRRSIVVVTATDGYQAVFSWAELYLSPIGDGALIYYERDGKPLDDREGRIALVSLQDTSRGARHVRSVQRIEIRRIDDAPRAPDAATGTAQQK